MKRDMELIRTILLIMEDDEPLSASNPRLKGYEEDLVGRHVLLLMEAGLVVGHKVEPAKALPFGIADYITWHGYEFLDAARDEQAWKSTESALQKVGRDLRSISLGILQSLLTDYLRQTLGLAH